MPNMAPEIYQPLNPAKMQVRIFRLAPGDFGRPIKGSLTVISLDKLRKRKWQELRQWDALSYVWGTSPRDQIMKLSRRSILITETLHCALHYLRDPYAARYFWIDQICINQDDIEERGSQVTLMRHIYSSATYVVAWFGVGLADVEHLFEMTMNGGKLLFEHCQKSFEEEHRVFFNRINRVSQVRFGCNFATRTSLQNNFTKLYVNIFAYCSINLGLNAYGLCRKPF